MTRHTIYANLTIKPIINASLLCNYSLDKNMSNVESDNINWKDVQIKNVVNNVDMSSLTKWPVQNLTHRTTQKHVQHHAATDI